MANMLAVGVLEADGSVRYRCVREAPREGSRPGAPSLGDILVAVDEAFPDGQGALTGLRPATPADRDGDRRARSLAMYIEAMTEERTCIATLLHGSEGWAGWDTRVTASQRRWQRWLSDVSETATAIEALLRVPPSPDSARTEQGMSHVRAAASRALKGQGASAQGPVANALKKLATTAASERAQIERTLELLHGTAESIAVPVAESIRLANWLPGAPVWRTSGPQVLGVLDWIREIAAVAAGEIEACAAAASLARATPPKRSAALRRSARERALAGAALLDSAAARAAELPATPPNLALMLRGWAAELRSTARIRWVEMFTESARGCRDRTPAHLQTLDLQRRCALVAWQASGAARS